MHLSSQQWQFKSIHDMLMKQLRARAWLWKSTWVHAWFSFVVSTCTSPPNSHRWHGICSAL